MFVADRTGVGATQIFVDPMWEDTAIIKHGRLMVDGLLCRRPSRHSANGFVDDCSQRRTTGTPTYHNAYVGFDTDRRSQRLYIAQDATARDHGCGRSM
jgi:hypothetical protein